MKVRDLVDAQARWEQRQEDLDYQSEASTRRKEAAEYQKRHEARIAAYGLVEGDLVELRDHHRYGRVRGDRLHVDELGLICRLVPGGDYIDIDLLRKVEDQSMGVLIQRWDDFGALVGDRRRPLTEEELEAIDARNNALYLGTITEQKRRELGVAPDAWCLGDTKKTP